MTASVKEHQIAINFVDCPSPDDRKEREEKIISILVDSALKLLRKRKKLTLSRNYDILHHKRGTNGNKYQEG